MRPVMAILGGYKTLASSALAPALGRPRPVRRAGTDLDVTIEAIDPVADDVVSLTLVGSYGGPLPRWRPGAHLAVFLPSGRQRQYSLCGDPRDRLRYRIAVRLIQDGAGGSREIHESLRAGDALRVRCPRNAFPMATAESYLFVAGGIGITPILPMVTAAHRRGIPWRLIYLGRTRTTMPFLDELAGYRTGQVVIRPDDEFGVPDMAELLDGARRGDAVYVCGPPPVLDAAHRLFATRDTVRELHTERFCAPRVIGGRPFLVELRRSGVTVQVAADESVLAAVQRVLPEIPYSCRQGFCGSCRAPVLAGQVEHRDNRLVDGPIDGERADSMLLCVSRGRGPLVLDL
jgi:ferredoxin-NADP reductase